MSGSSPAVVAAACGAHSAHKHKRSTCHRRSFALAAAFGNRVAIAISARSQRRRAETPSGAAAAVYVEHTHTLHILQFAGRAYVSDCQSAVRQHSARAKSARKRKPTKKRGKTHKRTHDAAPRAAGVATYGTHIALDDGCAVRSCWRSPSPRRCCRAAARRRLSARWRAWRRRARCRRTLLTRSPAADSC